MALSSRIFRVYVSSAFSGLAEERNILHGEVFPKLRELCRQHGWRFHAADLRWDGCREEIARWRTLSPRPVFLCAIGDRYGHRPLPETIPTAEFTQIERRVPSGSIAFLREWYRLDANAVPPVYVLARPSGVFSQPANWAQFVEKPLRALLEEAVRGLDLLPEQRLKYEASADEQEIQAAMGGTESAAGHVLCFARVSAGGSPEPDAAARARLEALRQRLRQQLGANCIEYAPDSLGAFAATATAALSRIAQAEIAGREKGAAGVAGEDAAHEAFGRERARCFTGRAKTITRISQYLHGADPHPLVVVGAPGAGKSAALAHSVERYRAMRRDAAVIYRAIGASTVSLDGRAVLAEVCRKLDAGALESSGYAELIERFPERIASAAGRGPVVVVLDGLDHLAPLDLARDLDWLPHTLPAGARLIVSTAPGELLARMRKKVPAGNIVELETMSPEDGGRLLDLWLREAGRALSAAQRAGVIEGFRAWPLPHFLRLTFEEARRWHSHAPVDGITQAPDVAGQLDTLLDRLSARHGWPAVSRSLGYLAAARQGLAEDELFDLLALDGLATPATWVPLYADLRPLLAERAGDGVPLVAYAHREFAEAAAQAFLAGEERRARHQALARYFAESAYPDRRFFELPRQQAQGGLWAALEATLTSLEFIEGKAHAGLLRDLIDDYRTADACWRAERLGQPPWRDWGRFLASEARTIESRIGEYPQILFQQAFNQSREGRVSRAAQALVKQGREPRQPWFERVNRPELPPGQECVATLSGHSGPVSAVVTMGGLAVSGAADGTLRVWRISTGACVRVLRGHTSGVMAVVSVGEDRVVSASWDSTVRVWDLATGECVHVLAADTCPVVSLAEIGPNRVAAGAADGSLRLWDIASGRVLVTFTGHHDRINHILPLAGGRIASASDDGSVQVWSEEGSKVGTLTGHGGPALHLCWIAGALSVATRSGKVVLWDVEGGRPRDVLNGHLGAVAGTAPLDAARMVSWSYDQTLRLWSLVDGSQLSVLHRHQAPVTNVKVLDDGRLISASQDGTLRLWDGRGESTAVLMGHRSWVNAIALSPAGLLSGSRDGTVRVWDLDAVAGERPARPVETPAEIAHAQVVAGVYVVDASTAVSLTGEPEWLHAWDLAAGRSVQSVAGASEAGRQLRERIRGLAAAPGPSYCGRARSDWGFAITGAAGTHDEPAPGLALTRERQREGGMVDYETGALALYPLVCRPFSWTFECEYGIAFDARTREPHIVRAHHSAVAVAAASAAASAPSRSGGLRSLWRKFRGPGGSP
jgi:hypothetical protein